MSDIHLAPLSHKATESLLEDDGSIVLSPLTNTWSRAARRQAARAPSIQNEGDAHPQIGLAEDVPPESTTEGNPLMRVRITFIPPVPPNNADKEDQGDWRGATLGLDFLEGRDRSSVDALWKFLLTKAGLVGRNEPPTDAPSHGGRAGRGRRKGGM